MKKSLASLALFALNVHALLELSISKHDANGQASHVAWELVKRGASTVSTNVFDVNSWNSGGYPQEIGYGADIGAASHSWERHLKIKLSSSVPTTANCGTFYREDSTTYIELASPVFNSTPSNDFTVTGPYARDSIGIGNVLLENVQFGVAEQFNNSANGSIFFAEGMLGLGYSHYTPSPDVQYPNLLDALVQSGAIASRLFSIFLGPSDQSRPNDFTDLSGSIVFGGVDLSRYVGNLVAIDPLNMTSTALQDPEPLDFLVTTVTGLSVNINDTEVNIFSGGVNDPTAWSNQEVAIPVYFEAAVLASYVPHSIWAKLSPLFPQVDNNNYCNCSYRKSSTFLTLEFGGGINITVSSLDFIVPAYNESGGSIRYTDGTEACYFGIQAQADNSGPYQLGDSILRSMYVVTDQDNGMFALAQAQNKSGMPSNIVAVGAGANGLADAITQSFVPAEMANTYLIASAATSTAAIIASTLATPIGTATGRAADPESLVLSSTVSTTSKPVTMTLTAALHGTATGTTLQSSATGTSTASSNGAALGTHLPSMSWTSTWGIGAMVWMIASGFAVVLV